MAIPEVYPFAEIGYGPRFPDWIRGLRQANGVYVFREHDTTEIIYIGESHTDRLYATLTRHFQAWTNAYDTAGVTYARDEVDVAVIIVSKRHVVHLQNELICTLAPRDNRLQCEQLLAWEEEADEEERQRRSPPRDYDYDVHLLLEGLEYEFPDSDHDVPF